MHFEVETVENGWFVGVITGLHLLKLNCARDARAVKPRVDRGRVNRLGPPEQFHLSQMLLPGTAVFTQDQPSGRNAGCGHQYQR